MGSASRIMGENVMTGHLFNYLQQPPITKQEIDSMTPNPHYINMLINFSILGTLIYVAIQVS
tara:strand:+ start:79 stop:264 length:186 start_codon:yes stop_codon:yes gene_type:complete